MSTAILRKAGITVRRFLLAITICSSLISNSQRWYPDSMMRALTSAYGIKRVDITNAVSKFYWTQNYDSSVLYANRALGIAKELNYIAGEAEAFRNLGVTSIYKGLKEPEVKPFLDKAILLFKSLGDKKGMADTYNNFGSMWMNFQNYPYSLIFFD